MRKVLVIVLSILLLLSFSTFSFAGIVDDAKEANVKQKREQLVERAQAVLKYKATHEARAKKCQDILDKLDAGEDVFIPEDCSISSSTWTTSSIAVLR